MESSFVNVVFASKIRKKILLLLKDGPKDTNYFLKSLNTTRQTLLPQIKILKNNYFIDYQDNTYELTCMGKKVANVITPLLDTFDVFEEDLDYWGNILIDSLPPLLLTRIEQLKGCEIVTPPPNLLYELDEDVTKSSFESKSVYLVSTNLHPRYPSLLSDLLHNNIDVYFVLSEDLYSLLQSKYQDDIEKLITNDRAHFYVSSKELCFQSIILNDHHFIMHPTLENKGLLYKYIVCSSQTALEWAKELVNYYLEDSIQFTEI